MNNSQYRVFLSMLNTRRNPNGILFAKGDYWFATMDDEAIQFIYELINMDIVEDYVWHAHILSARIVLS